MPTEADRRAADDELERRVRQRTAELTAANAAQRTQIDEREREAARGRQSEERLRLVIDTALDAVIGMDAEGRVIEWNAQAETIFGWRRGEALGRMMDALIIPPAYRAAHRQGLERFLRTGEAPILNRRVEVQAVRRDGTLFPVELAVTPARDGQAVFFTAFVRDITDRQQIERQLARQAREAQALHRITQLAAETDSFEEALQSCVDAVCEMTGWPVGHVYRPDPDGGMLRPSTIWHLADASFDEFRRVTERTPLEVGQGIPGRIWEARRPIWIPNIAEDANFPRRETCARLALRAAFGFPVSIRGDVAAVLEFLTTDATPPDEDLLRFAQTLGEQVGRVLERQQAGQALRESGARFRFLAESMPQKMFTARPNGDVDYFNRQWMDFTGLSFEQIRDWGWLQFIHPDDVDENIRRWKHSVETGEPFELEHRFRAADGSYHWHLSRAVPMRDASGAITMWVGSNTEIEPVKHAERRWEFLAQASDVLASSLDYRETLAAVARLAVPDIGDWCAVDVVDEQGQPQRLAIAHVDESKVQLAWELHEKYPPDPDAPHGTSAVLRTGRPDVMTEIPDELLAQGARDAEHLRIMRELGLKSYICVPLSARGRTLGVLTLVSSRSGRRYTEADVEFAQEVARRAAMAVDNARLYEAAQQEIAQRKRALKRLHRSRERLKFTLDAVRVGTWDWDLVRNHLQWSDNVEEIHGLSGRSVEELLDHALSLMPPEDLERVEQQLFGALRTGEPYEVEYRLHHEDGTVGWFEAKGRIIFNESGRPVWMAGVCAEITERKQAEETLAERARLALLRAEIGMALAATERLPDILQQCAENLVRHLDAAFARIWLVNRQENVLELTASAGQYTHLNGPHGRIPMGMLKIGRIAETGQPHLTNDVPHDPHISDHAWAHREGMVAFAGYPLAIEGRVVGVMALFARHVLDDRVLDELAPVAYEIAQCIERRRAEEALLRVNAELQQRQREMEQFVYIISHDLKSPLVTMTGFVGLLREDVEAGRLDDAADSMTRIERATRRMSELIDDLLELSRVGRVRNEPEWVDVAAVVGELRDELAPRLAEAGATLEMADDLPPVLCDRSRLTEVFENLLINALKYGCDGPVRRIEVGSQTVEDKIRYSVRDHGRGIAPQYQEKVFELFQRLQSSQEGTGVGLAIVRRIMEVSGGRVWVESALGQGATFWIEFPALAPPDSVPAAASG